MKRSFTSLTLEDVLRMLGQDNMQLWQMAPLPHPPSEHLWEDLRRLQAFDLENTEAAKLLLIDALLAEIVPNHPQLKVWKAMPLESGTLTGIADYLIAPKRAYLTTPLMCAVEAKRDDFVQGRTQCVAEMLACQWNNQQNNHSSDVFGIVSNGQGWQFYKLTPANEVFETGLYTTNDLSELLGVLDALCSECTRLLSSQSDH